MGGTGTWYNIGGAGNSDIILSDSFITSCCTFRNGQAVAVDTGAAGVVAMAGAGNTWSVDSVSQLISFQVNLTGTSLAFSDTIALLGERGEGGLVGYAEAERKTVTNDDQLSGAVGRAARAAGTEWCGPVVRGIVRVVVRALPVVGELPAEAWMMFKQTVIYLLSGGAAL